MKDTNFQTNMFVQAQARQRKIKLDKKIEEDEIGGYNTEDTYQASYK